MRIAVACDGDMPDSPVSDRAARAPFFIIFDDGEVVEVIRNPFAVGGGGAGFAVAKMLADKGVQAFVCSRAGPNFEEALRSRGVELRITERGRKAKDVV